MQLIIRDLIYRSPHKYNCGECGTKIETKNSNYWGVTKAALSIIYFIH